MGNQQSIEAHRRQGQRLSKPRTGSRVTSGLLSPNAFTESPWRYSNPGLLPSEVPSFSPVASTPTTVTASEAGASSLAEQHVGRRSSVLSVGSKASRRRSIFRSRSTTTSRERPSTAEPRNSRVSQLSRANSMTYESAIAYYGPPPPQLPDEIWPPPPGSRTSWNYDLTSYEAKRLLNLVEEAQLEQDTKMSETKVTVVTEATWKSSNPTQPVITTLSRANSDMSLYMPVRRKSVIRTPGVATRSHSTRPSSRARNHRHSVPPTPNLSRQQSFESHRSGIVSMPPPLTLRVVDPDSIPRVVTPCEDAYQSIGAFKLGTLRITNGAASPVSPEMERPHRVDEDQSSGMRSPGYFPRDATGSGFGSSGVALKVPEQPSRVAPTVAAPQPRSGQLSPIVTTFASLPSPGGPMPTPPPKDLPAAAKRATGGFIPQTNAGPFSMDRAGPTSPQLQTTSKHTALEDQLFEVEDDTLEAQLEYSLGEVLDVRVDPNAKSQPGSSPSEAGGTTPVTRTDSGFVSMTSPSSSSDYSNHALTKADSGYSSNVSLRSFRASAHSSDGDSAGAIEKHASQSSQKGSSGANSEHKMTDSAKETPAPPRRDAPPPPVPPKDYPPLSPASQPRVFSIPRKSLSSTSRLAETRLSTSTQGSKKSPRPTPSPITTLRSLKNGPKSPDSMPHTPASARSARSAASARSESSNSALSIGSGSTRGNKLQRLLSGARRESTGPLTVHTTHVSHKTHIPAIPRDVESKLHEHSGRFPLTTKRLALRPHPSLDTLKTIFSVGSLEAAHESATAIPAVSPVPELVGFTTDARRSAPTRTHSLTSSITHVAALLIPRKPISRKPVPVRQAPAQDNAQLNRPAEPETSPLDEADFASYSATKSNLGGSADDTAFKAMQGERQAYFSPTSASRTMSLTASMEATLGHRNAMPMSRPSTAVERARLPSPSLPSPIFASMLELERQARSSSPAAQAMRRQASLRVPPPLRSQSSAGRMNSQSLSRKTSRDSIHSYPAAQPRLPLSRKTSREEVRSYPPYQQAIPAASDSSSSPPPIPPMNPRRNSATKTPNWEVQTDHDVSRRPSRSSIDSGSRHGSLSSASQSSGPAWQRPANPPQLRHRASFDGYGQRHGSGYAYGNGYGVHNGYAPSMSNGYSAPAPSAKQQHAYDPWSNHNFDPSSQQWDQYGRYPPQVHRSPGHYRNRSMGSRDMGGRSPPYRVLHSYNSPAYRNVPIWG